MIYHSRQNPIIVMFIFIIILTMLPIINALASETGVVNVKVILRKSASKDSQALQTLPEGEEITVLSVSDGWYRVRYGDFTGYIMTMYVDLSGNSQIVNQDKIDALGDAPGALYIGDEGPDVKKLQSALKILGYYTLSVDGIYGNGTTIAVALYQQDKDIEADGVAGKHTIRSIFGSCASTAEITVSGRESLVEESISSTNRSSTSDEDNVISSFSEIGAAPDPSKEGDSGSDVVKLQQALYLLGYYTSEIDGEYGQATKNAVMRFQENRSMNADGIAGSSTIRVLFSGTGTDTASAEADNQYKTIVLDWFEDNVSSVIPKNAKFQIKDV